MLVALIRSRRRESPQSDKQLAWLRRPSRADSDGKSACAGGVSGLLGGFCCVAGAVATATSLGVLSFLTTWQDRYGMYFIAASVALMLAWIARQASSYGLTPQGLRRAAAGIGRQALVMGVIYGGTLAITFAAMRVAAAA